jgi:hypothetical protein
MELNKETSIAHELKMNRFNNKYLFLKFVSRNLIK